MMDNEDRYKEALLKIANISFDTGRADLLGLRVREVIREAICPDTPCPRCNGVGEIPSTNRDCGICKSYKSLTIGYGECKKGIKEGWVDECSSICEEFDDLCPMQTCPSCNGKKFKKVTLEEIDDRFEILDL